MRIKIITICVLVFLSLPLLAFSDNDFSPQSLVFYLKFNGSKLSQDFDFGKPYEFSTLPPSQHTNKTENLFRGEVISSEKISYTFYFDPIKNHNPLSSNIQKVMISIPSFNNVQKVDFFDPAGRRQISMEIFSSSAQTNTGDTLVPVSFLSPLPSQVPPAVTSTGYSLFLILGIAGAVIIAVLIVWAIIKRRSKSDNNDANE